LSILCTVLESALFSRGLGPFYYRMAKKPQPGC
jgi:hypothetical protein